MMVETMEGQLLGSCLILAACSMQHTHQACNYLAETRAALLLLLQL